LLFSRVVTCLRRLLLVLLFLLLPLTRAYAQDDGELKNRFALGVEFSIKTSDYASQEDYARGQLGPDLLWRFGKATNGWGFHYGLNWYAVKLERPIGGVITELGELHVRPLGMAGYGYTRVYGRYSITGVALAGYAIGSINLSDEGMAAYRKTLGVASADAEAGNTFVLKPEASLWYDFTRRAYLNVTAGYMLARPEVRIITPITTDTRTARADQLVLKVGIVYSLF
jgi:hypothetical protein